ncbi:MAG: ribosome silencing factor [Anaerolineales bacterium]|nr:ribosome silencing factor [Anaerolineales bacterium]MCB9128462.1 ribosome silencing factor [Ardenticatenales bacterium]
MSDEQGTTNGKIDAAALARHIVFSIEDRKGEDIVMLDLNNVAPIADYFVIATADNERQLGALRRSVEESVQKELGLKPSLVEGNIESGWILLDYNWVMVHIFGRAQRAYYRLESLWDDAAVVLRVQ